MDLHLRRNEIEEELDDSSGSDLEGGKTHSVKDKRKLKKLIKDSPAKTEVSSSRKRKLDYDDEEIKPSKISRNTPSKKSTETFYSPSKSSSETITSLGLENVKRAISGSPNKFLVVSVSPVKVSAKKNLFETDTCKRNNFSPRKTVEKIKSNGETENNVDSSSDDSEVELKVGRFSLQDSKCSPQIKEKLVKSYAVKSPSKSSPLKVRLISSDSPLSKLKNIRSPARNIFKENNNSSTTPKKESSRKSIAKSEHDNTGHKTAKKKSEKENQQDSSDDENSLTERATIELNKLKVDMNEKVLTPKKSRRSSVTFSPLPPKHRPERRSRVCYTEVSEEENSPKKSFVSKTPDKQKSSKIYKDIDDDNYNTPVKSSEKVFKEEKITSSKKGKDKTPNAKDRQEEDICEESKLSERARLELNRLKVDMNDEVLTPRRGKGRRSSVTFSPLPPKHKSVRTPKKYVELSKEENSDSDFEVKKVVSKTTPRRRSSKHFKDDANNGIKTPVKEKNSDDESSSDFEEKRVFKEKKQCSTPLQRKSISVTTPVSKKSSGRGFLTPSMAKKESREGSKAEDELDTMRRKLHISTVPKSLPCRESEFSQIKSFLFRKIEHLAGGCMYISGVPGTGKTATVHAVVRSLQEQVDADELSDFDFVEVNGLRLTEPKQAYVRIYQTLTDKKVTPDQAQQLLSRKFSGTCKKSTIILVDELDYLCNRRQDVVYNILDWPTRRGSALVVLTISNTMDLAERTLKGRVTSRMGLTRITFQPYSHHQLQQIVLDRLCGSAAFHPDAVQLVARKVAAVSGDARRALDICRRTTELVSSGEQVTAAHVQKALMQIFSGPRVQVIQQLSGLSQLVLRSLRDVSQRTGIEEATVSQLYKHLEQISVLDNVTVPTTGAVLQTCVLLVNLGLVVAERGRQDINRKLSLNVSSDDIHYALDNVRSL